MSDPWPGRVIEPPQAEQWPGRVVETRQKPADKIAEAAAKLPPLNRASAIDGDTLRADASRIRLWGVDAPERNQLGWNRQGQAVPIGQQSRDWLQGSITNTGNARLGDVAGTSYGRLVAPISLDGQDAGLASIRSGNALAAARYLRSDPARQFSYQAAENQARLNRQGAHQTYFDNPAEYRAPDYVAPEREEVAQFFDTPTPWAGLRPEDEKRFFAMAYDPTVPIEQVAAFARENGALVDVASLKKSRAYYLKHGKAGGINYTKPPEYLIDPGGGAGDAAARGYGQGFLMSGLDEAGALADMVGLTPGRANVWNNPETRLADLWSVNQQQNSAILRHDEANRPVASYGGQIAGGLTSGFLLPYSRVTSLPKLAGVGAGYGGIDAALDTDGSLGERVFNPAVPIQMGLGAIIDPALAKVTDAAAPVVARGYRALTNRDGTKPAQATTEAAGEYVSETAGNSAVEAPGGNSGDVWPGRVVDPQQMIVGARMEGEVGSPVYGDNIGIGRFKVDGSSRSAVRGIESPVRGSSRFADENPFNGGAQVPWQANDDEPIASGLQDLSAVVRRRAAMGMDGEPGASVSSAPFGFMARRLLDPLNDAERAAAAARVAPRDVLPVAANTVDGVEEAAAMDAGRFVPAKAPNERDGLTRGTVRGWNGEEVPKVGPTDLVGWLRLRGGLRDQDGELSHMGLTNAPRRGLEHVGQEARFGPLVNPDGDTLDDAALAAWEAGYFPEFDERPSVNDFLDALRDTYNGGSGRRFLPDDWEELERFEALRGERYDLEQQQREAGTVWNDMATDADDAAPFPPVEAYEEWPSDAIERVGNVDVTKLDTPQDIRRALKTSYNAMGGFDAATRGRVTQAETERLASELGMTADDLLSRRKGQALNAEEALAARQILAKSGNELVNLAKRMRALDDPGDELSAEFRQAWMRHVAIQEQVAGMTAEAGRTLQQFRMAADSRAVRGNVLAGFVRGGGGQDSLREAAETLLDAVESGPGVFNVLASKATKPKWRNRIAELYINFLLSNPATHVVNMTSNTLTSMAQLPEFATAAALGKARELYAKGAIDRVTGSEVGARAFGLIQGAKEGARMFARAVRTGEASDFVSKVEGDEYKAISGLKGEIIRVPTRLLTAEDELFKGIARRMELNGAAARQAHKEGLKGEAARKRIAELSANPTDELLEQSLEYGRYLTFQTKLGPIAQSISNVSQNSLIAKLYLPFIRTPTNLLKFAAERSPAAPFMPRWRKEIAAGGARRDVALARMMVGTGFGMAIYQAALNGQITGALPSDAKKARLLRAEGWQEYSIKIGDTYYSYKRLDPFAMTLGVAADLATLPDGMSEKEKDDKAALLVMSIMGNLASKTWLSGVSDLVAGLDDPQRNADNMIERLVGSLTVPAGVAGVARAIDPTARQVESVQDAIMARTPGMRDDLLPKRDIWGEEVTFDSGFLSPAYTSTAKRDPVNLELLKLGEYAPGYPSKKVGGRELTPEEHDRYVELAGKASHKALTALVTSREWQSMDAEGKVEAAEKIVRLSRKTAREALFGDKSEHGDEGWPGKVVESAGGGSEQWPGKPVGSRDVVGELEAAIPGVRFTSGFRSPEYNASLAERGYSPAVNSEHLDGSALDMLPPPGKSLGWLRQRVAALDPKARLLVHDGHLHAGFNGFFGAPVLGGARSFGDRNPNSRGQ